jgi:hypothetical protein
VQEQGGETQEGGGGVTVEGGGGFYGMGPQFSTNGLFPNDSSLVPLKRDKKKLFEYDKNTKVFVNEKNASEKEEAEGNKPDLDQRGSLPSQQGSVPESSPVPRTREKKMMFVYDKATKVLVVDSKVTDKEEALGYEQVHDHPAADGVQFPFLGLKDKQGALQHNFLVGQRVTSFSENQETAAIYITHRGAREQTVHVRCLCTELAARFQKNTGELFPVLAQVRQTYLITPDFFCARS